MRQVYLCLGTSLIVQKGTCGTGFTLLDAAILVRETETGGYRHRDGCIGCFPLNWIPLGCFFLVSSRTCLVATFLSHEGSIGCAERLHTCVLLCDLEFLYACVHEHGGSVWVSDRLRHICFGACGGLKAMGFATLIYHT
ncbi:hypothetical protein GGR56DRAFT_654304 [Xylariaceae sp. FL0804]|nr:hypothetical protein GGR56DRAFT_654304 [Xylariaceae sp. FL0804]